MLMIISKTNLAFLRNMTIEEVSVLFDTGRKGDAQAAARKLGHGDAKEQAMADNIEDADKAPQSRVTAQDA